MIPIGALVGAAMALRRGGAPRKKTEPEAANFLLRIFLAFPMVTIPIVVPYGPIFLAPLCVLAAFPALTLRFLLVPLGLPRVAYWFSRISPPIATSTEKKAAAVLFGSLAGLRARAKDEKAAAWLQARADEIHSLRATGLAANGFLALLRGQPQAARLLFEAADSIPGRLIPRLVRRPVQTWLVADAARSGDWRAVEAIAQRGWQRWPRAMGLIARRLLADTNAPSDAALWLAWLAAPHRRATLPILRRALDVPRDVPAPVEDAAPERAAESPVESAIAAHAAFVRAPSSATVVRAAQAWDAARASSSECPVVARRALALETPSDPALARIFEVAESELAPYSDLAPDDLGSTTLEAAAARSRGLGLDDIETTVKALRERTQRAKALGPADEWMEWMALRGMCERARGDGTNVERQRTVFSVVYPTACNHAAWLFNQQGQKLLANVIFRWLADEAATVADERVRALLRKNVAAGAG